MKRTFIFIFFVLMIFTGCERIETPDFIATKKSYYVYKTKDTGIENWRISHDALEINIARVSDGMIGEDKIGDGEIININIQTKSGEEYNFQTEDGKLNFYTIDCPDMDYYQLSNFDLESPTQIARQEKFHSVKQAYSVDYTKENFLGDFPYFEPEGWDEIKYFDKREDGFIPNSETAIAIGKIILSNIYGEHINSMDFKCELNDDVWLVEGCLSKDKLGGVPMIKIRKSDGKVLGYVHTK